MVYTGDVLVCMDTVLGCIRGRFRLGLQIKLLSNHPAHILHRRQGAVINALPHAVESDLKDLSKVLKLLEEFCFAGENIMSERYKFYQRQQEEGEPIETFITALRTMARTCAFTEDGKDFSAQMIRDRLVCGMRDGVVRKKLLSIDSQPTLETCIKESRSTAATVHQAQECRAYAILSTL